MSVLSLEFGGPLATVPPSSASCSISARLNPPAREFSPQLCENSAFSQFLPPPSRLCEQLPACSLSVTLPIFLTSVSLPSGMCFLVRCPQSLPSKCSSTFTSPQGPPPVRTAVAQLSPSLSTMRPLSLVTPCTWQHLRYQECCDN